ncbi:MAG: hypothetical protein E6I97_14500 [Chloroflexi bacterium]|nr:MAG: hypothetical protein E6I97_14500 [Chloroflexota bacterium]
MGRWRDRDYWDYYEPSIPRRVEGGIKTRSERGEIGETWWSKRWIKVLESFSMGTRLTRGRSYARQGQVVSIDVEPGIVKAKVQGSQPRPYNVKIRLEPLTDEDWDKVTEAMASQAIFAAKLLAGEMPQNIEEAFASVLREKRAATSPMGDISSSVDAVSAEEENLLSLEEHLDTFWRADEALESFTVNLSAPTIDKAVLKRLGDAPFTVGNTNIVSLLAKAYDKVDAAVSQKMAEGA